MIEKDKLNKEMAAMQAKLRAEMEEEARLAKVDIDE